MIVVGRRPELVIDVLLGGSFALRRRSVAVPRIEAGRIEGGDWRFTIGLMRSSPTIGLDFRSVQKTPDRLLGRATFQHLANGPALSPREDLRACVERLQLRWERD